MARSTENRACASELYPYLTGLRHILYLLPYNIYTRRRTERCVRHTTGVSLWLYVTWYVNDTGQRSY